MPRLHVFLAASCLTIASADVKLPAIFSSNMVLQRDMNIPVWGWADPGEAVTVTFAGKSSKTTADVDGNWILKIATGDANSYAQTFAAAGKNRIELTNVLVGDVWICSGQSNMAMQVRSSLNAEEEIAAAKHACIRLFKVGSKATDQPQKDCTGKWMLCSPETIGTFSATAYYFGRHLYKTQKVPQGLINSSWGGTRVEAWTSRDALMKHEHGMKQFELYAQAVEKFDSEKAKARFDAATAKYEKARAAWQVKARAARKAGEKLQGRPPRRPRMQSPPSQNQNSPSALYNGMIQPVAGFGIKGGIWYQGERNSKAGTAFIYRDLLSSMISNWREVWGQGDFPFFFVQLPNYKGNPNTEDWMVIRESFKAALKTPNTGMAIAIDVGELNNIHPKNKQAVGYRLGLEALRVAYGQKDSNSGPLYKSMKKKGDQIVLSFDHTGSGLKAKDGTLTSFVIAGADKKFVQAEAKIDGSTVVVWSDAVKAPEAVRYAWENNPSASLYSKEDLPASPFRTDTWPVNISE